MQGKLPFVGIDNLLFKRGLLKRGVSVPLYFQVGPLLTTLSERPFGFLLSPDNYKLTEETSLRPPDFRLKCQN